MIKASYYKKNKAIYIKLKKYNKYLYILLDLPNILRQIVETLQETVLVNEDLSEFMNESNEYLKRVF